MRMDENTNPEWKRLLRGTSSGRRALEIIDGLEAEIKRLRELLKVAICPECDGSGGIPHQIAEDAWQEQQCQWCAEAKAIKEVEK